MRAAAEIEPVALLIDLQIFAFGDSLDEFDLEQLALVAKHLLGLIARPELLREGSVLRDDLVHLLFNLREVFRQEGFRLREVVEEAVVDHWANRHLCAGPQSLDGLGHDVGRVVANQFDRSRIGARHEIDCGVLGDRIVEVGQHAIELHGNGALGERGRDAFGNFKPARSRRDLFGLAVWERNCDVGHDRCLLLNRCQPRR